MSLFRPHTEKRAMSDSLAAAIAESQGGSRRVYSGVAVNDESAMRLAAVWACVDLIAELVSTLPIDEFKMTGGGELVSQPRPALLDDPAGDGYGFEVWCRQLVVSMLTRGNGFGWIEAIGADGWPSQISILHPNEISVRRYLQSGPADWYRGQERVKRWPAGPLWHVPAFTVPGSPIGMSPIGYAAETIGVGLAAQKFGAQWFGDGAHPTSTLESDQEITQAQAAILKERVKAAMRDNREPLVLGFGTKMKAIQVSPEESQFLQTIKANADDIAKFFFRRPPGEGGSVTYANVEARSLDLLTYTLNGWMVRIEKALTRLRPRPRFVKFNPDALVRVDLSTRYAAHDSALRGGWKNVDEVRHDENLPPLPDGKGAEYLWPPYTTGKVQTDEPGVVQPPPPAAPAPAAPTPPAPKGK